MTYQAHECNPFVDDRGNFAKAVNPLTEFLPLLRLTSLREIMYRSDLKIDKAGQD